MTRLEFTLKSEEMFRKRASRAWWLVPLLIGVPAAKWVGWRFGNSAEFGASGLLLAFFVWAIWAEVRLRRKLGLLCPNCSRPLDAAASAHAWLTGNCKHCGKPVFDDRPDALKCESKLTKQEFTSTLEAETRRVKRRGKRWLVVAGVVIAAFLPLAWYFSSLAEAGRFKGVLWLYSGLVVTGLVAFALVFLGKFKRDGVPCPCCGRPLFGRGGQVATTTGLCIYCGGKIFRDRLKGTDLELK